MTVSVFDTKPYDREYLLAAGQGRIDWRFHEFRLTSETLAAAHGAQAVCLFVNDHLDATMCQPLAQAGIQHVALRCAGFNNVDLDAARSALLTVSRVPAYSPHAVAEHTIALLLTLNRKIHRSYNRVREHNFSLHGLIGFDLHGKTVGIVGTGKIGRIAAEIFRGFGSTVLVHDPVPSYDWSVPLGISYVPLQVLLGSSDIVSLHLPLTSQSHHLLNRESLASLKPGAYLINTSRGKLVDTTAVIEFLKTGHLGGVALDVYEEEEGVFFEDLSSQMLPDDELKLLLTFPNVLVTAHQAFLTREALLEIARVTVENLIRSDLRQPLLPETRLV